MNSKNVCFPREYTLPPLPQQCLSVTRNASRQVLMTTNKSAGTDDKLTCGVLQEMGWYQHSNRWQRASITSVLLGHSTITLSSYFNKHFENTLIHTCIRFHLY